MARKKGRKGKTEEVFHVEVIVKARVAAPENEGDKPSWEYFVKWAGYDDNANSWEPEENLDACQRLLGSFWEYFGSDNKDHFPGEELEPSEMWIKQEKEYFANEYNRVQDEMKTRKSEKGKQKKKDKEQSDSLESLSISTSNAKEAAVLTDDESSKESFEEQSANQGKGNSTSKAPPSLKIVIPANGSRKRKTVITSSSDEEPLLSSKDSRPKKVAKTDNVSSSIEICSSPVEIHSPTSLFSEPSSPEISLSSKKMPSKSLPNEKKIPRRGTNRLQANLGVMAPSDMPATHGISTKQRLGQGALAPILPKEVLPVELRMPPKPTTKKAIRNLTFKKRTADNSALIHPPVAPPQIEPVSAQLTSVNSPTAGLFSSPVSASPLSMPFGARGTIDEMAPVSEVESFLNSVMPPELSAPLNGSDSLLGEIHPLKPLIKVPLPTRLVKEKEKEWKWNGPLYSSSTELEVPYCNVVIYNPSAEGSLRFSMFLGNVERLEQLSMYSIVDIQAMLAIFRNPAQIAQLGPLEKDDAAKLTVLSQYMVKAHKSFLMPIRFDNNIVGQILCFPYVLHPVFCLSLPPEMYKEGELVMAILPYALDAVDIMKNPLTHSGNWSDPVIAHHWPQFFKLQKDTTSRPYPPDYQHAISLLNIPPEFANHIGHPQHKRPYIIWTGREPVGAQHSGQKALETRLLQTFLDKAGAVKAGSRSYVRIVFIHLGALKLIHHLPEFVERRSGKNHQQPGKNYPLQFYLYGSDSSVHPSMWHVHEIWPCGGIATFTPSSIAKDPLGALNLILKLNQHPLWACCIIPAALGMLANIVCGTGDPLKMFDQHTLQGIDCILQAIEDGTVALLEAPPEQPTIHPATDLHAQWISQYLTLLPPTQREALARGVAAFEASQSCAIDTKIAASLIQLQFHPAFMYTYRRYVIVCAEGHEHKAGTQGAMFEWTTVPQFDFLDEFYPKQTIGGAAATL